MADVHDIETRSYNLSQIKGKDTKPEILIRKFLHAQMRNNTELPFKLDELYIGGYDKWF
jgi:G:T-mismatch repair DNA endonuclease (very short patch repair protein)